MAECESCAARSGQATFPTLRARGGPALCCDCQAEIDRAPLRQPKAKVITRARYRAALRKRQASPQRDLVDLIMAAP